MAKSSTSRLKHLPGHAMAVVLLATMATSSYVVEERMPFHNPEHSCPTRREIDWPLLKSELRFYADQPKTRREMTEDAKFEWRIWVSRPSVQDFEFNS